MGVPWIAINHTNHTYQIKEYPMNGVVSNKIIGKLYPNELCLCHTEHDAYLTFLSSSGQLKDGLIEDEIFYRKDISELPYSYENINGTTYKIYHMRKSMPVYKAGGGRWGTVAAGMFVATDNCRPGDTHRDWMKVTYVKSTKGNWVKVTGDGVNYGFVDTGFRISSAGSKIALHGNW